MALSPDGRFVIFIWEAHGLRNENYNRLDVMRRRVKLFNRVLK